MRLGGHDGSVIEELPYLYTGKNGGGVLRDTE
jgi:hypothetical protein